MQCPRCQQDNPPEAKFCPECGTPLHVARSDASSTSNAGLQQALTIALEEQRATREILRIVSGSTTNLEPVFDAILRSAVRLCHAAFGAIYRYDGRLVEFAGGYNLPEEQVAEFRRHFPIRPHRGLLAMRAILDDTVVQVADLEQDAEFRNWPLTRAAGIRSMLAVPLRREHVVIGAIAIARADVGRFAEGLVDLLISFADQAVIAIENVRLFNETKEALEQQTATSEILRVIASSPTDIQPVFAAVAASAARLCDAFDATIFQIDGDRLRVAVHNGPIASHPVGQGPSLARGTPSGRAVLDQRTIHVADAQAEIDEYPEGSEHARRLGFRTVLSVPLMWEGVAIGVINLRRTEVRLFTERQVALLQTFADQAVIAIENVRLFNELQASNHNLKMALDQKTATGEVLQVISRSQTDVQPVFDAIADSAVRLFQADICGVFRVMDGQVHEVSSWSRLDPALQDLLRRSYPRALDTSTRIGQAILECRVLQITDMQDPRTPSGVGLQRLGFRSQVNVPMLRGGEAIGGLSVVRRRPGAFSDDQIDLLKIFADQAVIAIENVRLFTELKASNRELTTALDTQTATSDILRVISRSQTDVQPVFDAIVQSAVRLLRAHSGMLTRVAGDWLELAAFTSIDRAYDDAIRAYWPRPLHSKGGHTQAIRDRAPLNIADAEVDPRVPEAGRAVARLSGLRSVASVPLLRNDEAIGTVVVNRQEPGGFTDDEIALLQTFADQAVIAIENVRLFKELETRNRDLTEALDRQTATAEILRVISQSQTEVQPVFDAIVDNAMRLFRAWAAAIVQLDGQLLHLIAVRGGRPGLDQYLREQSPWSIHGPAPVARSIVQRTVIHVPDTELDHYDDEAIREIRRRGGMRSVLAAPMLRNGQPIGGVWVSRAEAGPFSPTQIVLLQTFANQAVIAIENARLLTELHARTAELTQSVGELRALGEVGQAISSTLDLQTVLSTIVARATQLSGTDAGVIYEYDEQREVFVPRATEHLEVEIVETMLATPVRKGEGATGRLAELQEPIQVPDILAAPAESRVRGALVRAGYRALLAVPLVRDDRLLGGLTVIRKATGAFAPGVIELLRTFATQSALAIQNARLFREIEEKSRQLEVASQHKSEFLANMSHELRTPLNAIIGFSEVLGERMFGELNEKQEEYLKDIYASGQHLLSLINDILDLSKIEAGRMELELTDFNLPATLDNALTLVRERAGRRGIALGLTVDERLEQIHADERKVRQVVLNLLSNAIKFTPGGGRIEVRAVPLDGDVEISVTDTGVGIAPEDQEAIFEEFRQVGTAAKKVEGTGLGLALSRKFVELHGGRIWVKSELGAGSTFTFTIPTRIGA